MNKFLLPLDLQFFAEVATPNDKPAEDTEPTTAVEPEKTPEGKVFTQEQVDAIIKDRLAREKQQSEKEKEATRKEAEQKQLVEQEQFKQLYEQTQQELQQFKADALTAKKDAMLAKAGYSEEQIEKYRKYLDGDTDESLSASLEELKTDIPTKKEYVDPSASNGKREKPETTDLKEAGKSLYQRLRESGSIRR